MRRYRSADALLERYGELTFTLRAPKTVFWPDPKMAEAQATEPAPSARDRRVIELVDLAVVLRDSHLDEMMMLLCGQLYRPRQRYCKRCKKLYGYTDTPRCPRCQATRREGWSFEAFPTLSVLASLCTEHTGRRWPISRVYALRNRMWAQIEVVMRHKGLLDEEEAPDSTRQSGSN